jgi:hypothetical protein
MRGKFNIKEINLLEKKLLEVTLTKYDLVQIKIKIKELKKILQNSSLSVDTKKFTLTRLNSLQRNSDRKLKQFCSENINFPLDLIYSIQFQGLIRNKRLLIHFNTSMLFIGKKNISLNRLSEKMFNPQIDSIGSIFIHNVIIDLLSLLEGKKNYIESDLFISDEGCNYRIEITLKKFYNFGKIRGPFQSEIKKIFIENSLSTICYIKTIPGKNGDTHFFVKENYISISKLGIFIGHTLENFDLSSIALLSKSSTNLFLTIEVNKYLFNQENNRTIFIPYRFAHKLIYKNNVNFLCKIMGEDKKNSPFWENVYSEKDIYSTPAKLCNIKNILIYIAYKMYCMPVRKDCYLQINLDELHSMGLLKETRTSRHYLFNSYLYLKLFSELYEWPDKSLEIFYSYINKSKIPSIVIKKADLII